MARLPNLYWPTRSLPVAGTEYRLTAVSLALLLALPFMQLGLTYWASIQGLSFVVVALCVRKDLSKAQFLLVIGCAVAMLASLAGQLYADTLFYSFFRILRQILCFYLIVCAAATVSWRPKPYFFDRFLPLIVVALALLVIVQFVTYTLKGWTYFFIPGKYFIRGFTTIADNWIEFAAARGFVADIRAAGPYSEPSYFGFVSLSLAVLVLRGVQSRLRQVGLLGLLLIALLCSKSASGVILFVLLILFAFRKSLSLPYLIVFLLFIVLALIGADVFLKFHLVERLTNITNPALELSGYIRLILPFKHIALVLEYKPLGVPLSEFWTFTSQHLSEYASTGAAGPGSLISGVSSGVDNGFLNLFVSFGFGAFFIVGALPFIIKDKLALIYLVFVCQFNGDILSPDKAAVLALVLSCRRAAATSPLTSPKETAVRFTPAGPFGNMQPLRTT